MAALDFRNGNLAVVDLHQINVRRALAAFLPLWAVFLEFDLAIEPENIHLPQRGANRLRLRLACDLDGLGDGSNAVITAKARGKSPEWQPSAVPLCNKGLRGCRVRRRLRRPGCKENEMPRAVGGFADVGDQLIGILRSTGAYDAQIKAERCGLLENE